MPMSLKMIQWASSSLLLTNFKYELELWTPSGRLLLSPSHLVLYMLPPLVKPSASLLLMPPKLPLVLLTEFVKAKKWAPIANLLFLLKYEPSLLVKAEMSGVPSNLRHDRWTTSFSEKILFCRLFVSQFHLIPSPPYFSLLSLIFTFSYSFPAVAFLKKIIFSLISAPPREERLDHGYPDYFCRPVLSRGETVDSCCSQCSDDVRSKNSKIGMGVVRLADFPAMSFICNFWYLSWNTTNKLTITNTKAWQ